jgi:hypothetical protein
MSIIARNSSAERHDVVLDVARQHVEDRLVGHDAIHAQLAREVHGVGDLHGRPLRDAHLEHLALRHQVVERAQRLLQRHLHLVAAALVEVDVVRA